MTQEAEHEDTKKKLLSTGIRVGTEVKTTIPGNVWKVFVKEGDVVKKGDPLFIMEVMKTEIHHDSPVDGKVVKVNVVNDQEGIDPGTVAVVIE